MGIHYFIQGLFVLVGLLSVLAAICNWNWFFTAQNTQFIVRNVGRKQARWFYALIGILMMGTGIFFFLSAGTYSKLFFFGMDQDLNVFRLGKLTEAGHVQIDLIPAESEGRFVGVGKKSSPYHLIAVKCFLRQFRIGIIVI